MKGRIEMINRRDLETVCNEYMDSVWENYDLPGISIGVVFDEEEFTGARGYRNYVTKDLLEAEHVFHCASVSKLFVSSGIMRLVEEGQLSLESRLCDMLSDLDMEDERWRQITLRQMLTHTAALGDVVDYAWSRPRIDEGALSEYVHSADVTKSPLLWSPGEGGFRYSNIAYEMLGVIIERNTGMSFEDYMQRELLKPTKMESSTFLTFERTGGSLELKDMDKASVAMPYRKADDKSIVSEDCYPYNREHGPSSTLTSNTNDLIAWARRHMDRSVLMEKTYDEVWRSYATVPNNGEDMGLGWFMRRQNGFLMCGHEGTDDGFRASFWICPELKVAVVILSNLSNAPVKRINKDLMERILKE